jgi:hypothetical protein
VDADALSQDYTSVQACGGGRGRIFPAKRVLQKYFHAAFNELVKAVVLYL